MVKYSNFRAMRSMTKASLQSIMKSPSAVVFTLAFPLVFILVFGFLGNGTGFHFNVADAPGTDTVNELYTKLHHAPFLKWIHPKDSAEIKALFKEGDLTAMLLVQKQQEGVKPAYSLVLNSVSTATEKTNQLRASLVTLITQTDPEIQKRQQEILQIDTRFSEARKYKMIDFILPGQLSFSLLSAGIFGTAFVFFNLRQTLVLKRFFATPVRREFIVLSEGLSRMLFQMTGAIIIIALGYSAFGFTLVHGFVTFIEMLLICAMSLMIFMGFGFIISGIAKSESSIPPLANLVVMPQLLLAGTFFSIDNFPKWLQPFCKALPLSFLNDALRNISFDGASLWDVRMDILCLLIWGVVVYTAASFTFKWE